MKSAVRRTGMYLYSSAAASAPRSVRAPHTTVPKTGSVRRQLMPSGLSRPFSASVVFSCRPATPSSPASVPAGAFQTPRCASVRAITPAIMPLAGNVSIWPSSIGSACLIRGKNTAPLRAASPFRFMPATPVCALLTEFQPIFESTINIARRRVHTPSAS